MIINKLKHKDQIRIIEQVNGFKWGELKKLRTFSEQIQRYNKLFKHKPYLVPIIGKIVSKLCSLQYTTYLDLNIGYYHIRFSKDSIILCTIILLSGKFMHKKIPFGVKDPLKTFQKICKKCSIFCIYICIYSQLVKGKNSYINCVLLSLN